MKKQMIQLMRGLNVHGMTYLMLGSVLMLSACIEENTWDLDKVDDSVNMEVKLAAPIAKGAIDVQEAIDVWGLDTANLKSYESGLLYLDYRSEFNVANFFKIEIPDQDSLIVYDKSEFIKKFDSEIVDEEGLLVIPPGKTVLDTFDLVFKTDITGGRAFFLDFSSGIFEIQGSTGYKDIEGIQENYTVLVPSLSFDAVSYKKELTSDALQKGDLVNLDGAKLTFEREGEMQTIVKVVYEVTNATSDTIMPSSSQSMISFYMQLKSLNPTYIEGYIDPMQTLEQVEQVKIPILSPDYVQDSTVYFYNPMVELYLENWVGIPFSMTLKKLMVVNTETRDSVDLEYTRSVIDVPAASCMLLDDNYSITPVYVDEVINRENSRIDEILNKVYNKAYISYCLTPNPDGQTETDNFIKVEDSKQMKLVAHTILPLRVKIDNYTLSDTLEYDFEEEVINSMEDDTAALNTLDSLILFLNVDSRIPVEVLGQVYIVDENNQVLDSLFIEGRKLVVGAAPIDADGIVTESISSELRIVYSEEKLEKWKKGKKFVFNVQGNSTDRTYVKAFLDQGLEYSLGVYTRATIDDELLDQ